MASLSSARHSNGTLRSQPHEGAYSFASPHTSQGSLSYFQSESSQLSRTSTIYRETRMSPTKSRHLKSQYPAQSNQSHVEFVLVASFDIHRGSIMEHQYPGFISSDEHMLAELMLPDQAHSRAQDWTIFFLHKDTAGDGEDGDDEDETSERRQSRTQNGDGDDYTISEDEADDDVEGPPLIYVLNLVSTKYDNTATRNAVCKAMAICTRHPFIHIYKPLLLLALDEYFKAPVPETLSTLYTAVNAMDLSLLPRLSLLERNILQASNARDMFIEKFRRMLEQRRTDSLRLSTNSAAKSLPESPLTPSGTNRALPRDTHEFESKVIYNNISVPVKVPAARFPEDVGDFSLIKLIQKFSIPHQTSPTPFTLHPHLTTGGQYTHPIIVLVNALLTQKRIIFLGHNMPSGEVAESVLAACTLASGGLLRGFTRHAFPYTDLSKIYDLLKVPGFIAGVTNPAFANKPEWWDLLCDLPTGKMTISSRIEPPQMTESLTAWLVASPPQSQNTNQDNTGDAAFMDSVLRNINNRLGENTIRTMWRGWVLKFTRMSAVFEELVYGTSALYVGGPEADAGAHGVRGHGYVWSDEATRQRELASNVHRIEGWRNTRSYYSLVQDLAHLYRSRPISSIDLHHHHDRLRTQKLTPDAAAAIYVAMEEVVRSDAEICQLLTVTPESQGGLFYVALGLLHPAKSVRFTTVRLLERIRRHEAGKHFWAGLGRFSKMAFERVAGEMDRAAAAAADGMDGSGLDYDDGNGDGELSRSTTLLEQISLAG